MNDSIVVPETNGLSQIERFVDAYIAPSKTFVDLKRSAAWWFPVVIVCVVSTIFAYVILHKIGLPTLVDGIVRQSSMLQDRMASASPEQAAAMRHGIETQFKFMWAAPVIIVLIGLLVSGLFFATANFGFGGKATYWQIVAVWFYGTLPLLIMSLLTIATVLAGVGSESFNVKNAVGTNIGYFLQDGDSPKWLVTLLSSVDVFAIWSALLLSLGISIVAGIKKSYGAIIVFGWWALYVLGQVAMAAVMG